MSGGSGRFDFDWVGIVGGRFASSSGRRALDGRTLQDVWNCEFLRNAGDLHSRVSAIISGSCIRQKAATDQRKTPLIVSGIKQTKPVLLDHLQVCPRPGASMVSNSVTWKRATTRVQDRRTRRRGLLGHPRRRSILPVSVLTHIASMPIAVAHRVGRHNDVLCFRWWRPQRQGRQNSASSNQLLADLLSSPVSRSGWRVRPLTAIGSGSSGLAVAKLGPKQSQERLR